MKPGGNIKFTRAVVILLIMAAVLTGFVLFVLLLPPEKHPGLYPPCPLHHWTGLYCAGCGSTRMFICLIHGDFAGAFHKNPLAFILLPFLAYGLLGEFCRWTEIRFPGYIMRGWMIYTLLVLILLYWLLRNIPIYPFILLRPY